MSNILRVFDGRIVKFISMEGDRRVTTLDSRKATKFPSKEDATKTAKAIFIADDIAEILGGDLIKENTMFEVVEVITIEDAMEE